MSTGLLLLDLSSESSDSEFEYLTECMLKATKKRKWLSPYVKEREKYDCWGVAGQRRTMSQKLNPVTHVIFDVDGLLLNTEVIYMQVYKDIAAKFGKMEYPWEVREKVLGRKETDSAEIFIKAIGLPITTEEFLKLQKQLQKEGLANAELMPGAERLINHLKANNIKMALASSSGMDSIKVKFSKHQHLYQLFNHVVSGTSDPEVKNGKPAPDIFLVCASRFTDKPDNKNCLVFEDAPTGVKAAVSAGMQVVMVPDPNLSKELTKEATIVLKSLNDFKPQLFSLPPFSS